MLPIFFSLFMFFSLSVSVSQADDSSLEEAHLNHSAQAYIDKALFEKVYKEKAWRNLLFFSQSLSPISKSMVDDQKFFFAKYGQTSPKAELKASLKALISGEELTIGKQTRPARCFFAARWHWLQKRLSIDKGNIPKVECKEQEIFDKNLNYEKLTMVFSSYYVNSPASMFGHTLLRLHRDTQGKKAFDNGLLDDAANFSAFVSTKNPLVYAYKGLSGGFKGRFSLLPYYKKVLDYSHSERRDIWEYELDFNKEELQFLKLVLYELGFFYFDYYYADDNCSFVLLKALEVVRPSLKLSRSFPIYTVPSDTIKVLYEHKPKIVTDINFRASSHTKYIQRAKALSAKERKLAHKTIQSKKIHRDENCLSDCKARVLDSVLDFIDYKTSIVDLVEKNKYSKLRTEILLERSEIDQEPKEIKYVPKKSIPHKGHYSGMLSFSGSRFADEEEFEGLSYFRFRPALHGFNSSSFGYSNLLKTGFLDVTFEYDLENSSFDVFEFHPFEIFTLRTQEPFYSPWSWHVDFGMNQDVFDEGFVDRRKRYYFEMGMGKARSFFNERLTLYALGHLQVGFSPLDNLRTYGGTNLHAGVILSFTSFLKFTSFGRYEFLYGSDSVDFLRASSRLNFYLAEQHEFFIEAQRRWDETLYTAGYRFYL